MKRVVPAVAAVCIAALASGCLSVVAYDNYWEQRDVRSKVAAEALLGEVAVGLVGGLFYSLDDDVTAAQGVGNGLLVTGLIDLQGALLATIGGLIRHGGAK